MGETVIKHIGRELIIQGIKASDGGRHHVNPAFPKRAAQRLQYRAGAVFAQPAQVIKTGGLIGVGFIPDAFGALPLKIEITAQACQHYREHGEQNELCLHGIVVDKTLKAVAVLHVKGPAADRALHRVAVKVGDFLV